MTDKEQIIIDGVDVGGCSVYKNGLCLVTKNKCNAVCDYASYYLREQLARKTQECEELKKQLMQKDEVNTFFNTPIEGWSSNPCDICENKNNYEQLTQECDTLKSQLDFEVQQKECIKQECEELKKKFSKFFNIDNQECWDIAFLKDENARYRKALEEIEKHIESYKKQCHIPNNCVDNRLCSTCFLGGGNELGENILDIINKAKGGNNENT